MFTWSIVILSAGIMTAAAPQTQAAAGPTPTAVPAACAPVKSDSGITHLAFSPDDDGHIQQTSLSEPCAAPASPVCCAPAASPACCAPAACTPVSCAAAALPGCGNTYGNSCNSYCGDGCCKQSCCDRIKNSCAWHRAHSTGDMFPHFAYYPAYHGYYYFRPYNWMTVLQQQSLIMGMGGDSRNPYSVAMFDSIYEDFEQRFPPIINPPTGSVQPLGSHLPNIEDLMND